MISTAPTELHRAENQYTHMKCLLIQGKVSADKAMFRIFWGPFPLGRTFFFLNVCLWFLRGLYQQLLNVVNRFSDFMP